MWEGVKPVKKKVEVIKNMTTKTTEKGVIKWIVPVKYYHNM